MFRKGKQLTLGQLGERAAAAYLKRKGYRIIDFNFKNDRGKRVGEIDIIVQEKAAPGQIVFVEVKARLLKNNDDLLPEENINRFKLHKLQKIAQVYLKNNHLLDIPYRFDAVSVWFPDIYDSVANSAFSPENFLAERFKVKTALFSSRQCWIKHIENIFI